MIFWVIIGLAAAVTAFFIAPALLIFVAVFHHKKTVPFEEYNWDKFKDHYYVPYLGRIERERDFVWSHSKKTVSATAHDGVSLYGEYYDLGFKRTAILFHGFNAEVYTNLSAHGAFLMKHGFNVLFAVHRAHSKSGGKWSGIGLREQNDVLSWAIWAQQNGISEILIYGVSMGGAAAAFASDKLGSTNVRAIVCDSGFYSVYEQMKRDTKKMHIPRVMLPAQKLLARVFLRLDLKKPVTDSLKNAAVPVMFIHGTADETVPCDWAKVNYEACARPKELLIVDGAPHTLSILYNETLTGDSLMAFINKYFA